jgi:transcriptional regulator with XRE-family HTH domain
MMLSPIALLFKHARERLEISQAEIATRLGVSRNFVNMVERGKALPDVANAASIAAVLGVSEQAVIDAIMETQFPTLKLVSAPPKRLGWFVEVGPVTYKRWSEFAESREYESVEAMIRKLVDKAVDGQRGKP